MESTDQETAVEVKPQPVEVKEDPTEVRYVLTQKGGQALLYGGHCFYKVRDGENRKTFWRCSKYRTESCEVRVTTLEDQVVGVRGQHKHPAENNSDRIRASSEVHWNWIRNRRRPNAAKVAEKIAERMTGLNGAATSLPTLIPSNPSSLTPLPTVPHTVVVTATNPINLTTPGLIRVTDSIPQLPAMPFSSIPHSSYPEPKRICLDQNHISSPSSSSHPPSPLLVKVRVSGSGESDFVEVEVATPTYSTLVSACCEELELVTSDVAKIRKLPNVLVRKDRDVQRMADGQELEVVMKGEGSATGGSAMNLISPPAAAASYPTTSMLTVNPFAPPNAAAAAVLLSNQVQVQRGSPVVTAATGDGLLSIKPVPEENGTVTPNHHIAVVTTSDSAVGELLHQTATTVNGLQ